jgi:hypothetical protein
VTHILANKGLAVHGKNVMTVTNCGDLAEEKGPKMLKVAIG